VGEAEAAELLERAAWRDGIGVKGRVVAGQLGPGLAGEQVVDGGERQVRLALAGAGVRAMASSSRSSAIRLARCA
jgi:hypothetical protein